jgi:hypothetical protein
VSDYEYDPDDYNFVPKYYQMDPKTEDLLPSSSHLADGMVVLIADPNQRERPEDGAKDWAFDRLVEKSRWCTVTHLEMFNQKYRPTAYQFIGVYEDGSKRIRMCGKTTGWFVKLDSVAESLRISNAKYRNLHTMVGELMRSTPPPSEIIDDQIEEVTQQILEMFR